MLLVSTLFSSFVRVTNQLGSSIQQGSSATSAQASSPVSTMAVCLLCCLHAIIRHIRVASQMGKVQHACIQVATQAISTMPTLLLFPILPFLLEVGLVFWWVFVAAYLYSSGMSHSLRLCAWQQFSALRTLGWA